MASRRHNNRSATRLSATSVLNQLKDVADIAWERYWLAVLGGSKPPRPPRRDEFLVLINAIEDIRQALYVLKTKKPKAGRPTIVR